MSGEVYIGDGIVAHGLEPQPRERTERDALLEEAAYALEDTNE